MGFLMENRLGEVLDEIGYEYAPEAFVNEIVDDIEQGNGLANIQKIVKEARGKLKLFLQFMGGKKDDVDFIEVSPFDE